MCVHVCACVWPLRSALQESVLQGQLQCWWCELQGTYIRTHANDTVSMWNVNIKVGRDVLYTCTAVTSTGSVACVSITCRALQWKLRLKRNGYHGNIHTYIAYTVQFHNNNELVHICIYKVWWTAAGSCSGSSFLKGWQNVRHCQSMCLQSFKGSVPFTHCTLRSLSMS